MFLSISITTGHYATPSRAVRRQSTNISIISPLPDNSIAQIGAPPHAGRTRNIGRRCRSPAPNHRADCKRQFDENGHNKRRCGRRCRQVGMERQLTTTARTSRCVIGHLPPREHLPLRISTPTVADICLLVRVTVQSYTVNAWLTVGVIDTARIVCPSVCLSHLSPAAAACGGFSAVGPAGRRYRSIAARPALSSNCRRAVSRCQLTWEAEH